MAVEYLLHFEKRVDGHAGPLFDDLVVTVEPDHTVGEMAEAVAAHLGLDPGSNLTLARADGLLDAASSPAAAGLVSGESLAVANGDGLQKEPSAMVVTTPSSMLLTVVAGPDIGRSALLGTSSIVAGRDATCDLDLVDPKMGRQQLMVWRDEAGDVWVEPATEAIGQVRLDGRTLLGRERMAVGTSLTTGSTAFGLRASPAARATIPDVHGWLPFHRAPYFPKPVEEVNVRPFSAVPTNPERPRFTYLAALAPLVVAVGLAVVLDSPQYLLFGLFSPIMAIASFLENKRRFGDAFSATVDRFNRELAEASAALTAALVEERRRRFEAAPDLVELHRRAAAGSPELWVRPRSAQDFLQLRLGLGTILPTTQLHVPAGGDDEYRYQMERQLPSVDELIDVPVTADLAHLGTLGVVGRETNTTPLVASLVVQACCWHSPEDLIVAAAVGPGRGLTGWMKWLPHTRSGASPLEGQHLVENGAEGDALLGAALLEAERRLQIQPSPIRFPWLLLILDNALGLDAPAVSRLLDMAPAAGISVVWVSEELPRVPRQAGAVVDARSPVESSASSIVYTDPERPDATFVVEHLPAERAALTARALAPLRDASSADAATAIPTSVPLFGSLGIAGVDAAWVAQQWQQSKGAGSSLAAPVGVTEHGPLIVDLVEHGPHGLIGGTSGAGKSELLMSMVASMMALHPPDKLNFLFIDYKGGASSEVFAACPHTAGCVTNLDAALANRALTSLRAELNRRMTLLSGRAKDMAELRASGAADVAPSLVIVIDEFATLVNEVPGFVDGVVDVAQRGRSLGIHLLLATQRPSGVVNDNIKANTNLRVALRMLDDGESRAIIGSGDAATIPGPLKGRGYIARGDGRLSAFQAAWSGAPLLVGSGTHPVIVEPFGHRPATSADEHAERRLKGEVSQHDEASQLDAALGSEDTSTQLETLLAAIAHAADVGGFSQGPAPWVEALPDVVLLGDALAQADERSTTGRRVGSEFVIGFVDEPEAQDQYPAVVNLGRAGGLLVLGAPGSGKSSTLRTLAVAAALDDSVAGGGGLDIVGLDFGSRQMSILADLPQCAAVAAGDEIEAVTRVISVLGNEFDRRRSRSEEATAAGDSTILLIIDGLDNLIQALEQSSHASGLLPYYDRLVEIVANGRHSGILTVATAYRRAGLRMALSAAFTERILLRQSDSSDYLDAGVGSQLAADLDLAPGQGLWSGADVTNATIQVARLTDGGEQAERELVAKLAPSLLGEISEGLRTSPLPATIELGMIQDEGQPWAPVLALADLTLAPVTLDLTFDDVYVQGDPRTGRSTLLAAIGRRVADAGGEVWLAASLSSPLNTFDGAHRKVVGDGGQMVTMLNELVAVGEAASGPGAADMVRLLLVDDIDRLIDGRIEVEQALAQALRVARWAVAGPTLAANAYIADQSLQQAKKARTQVLLAPTAARDAHDVFDAAPPWHPGLAMVPGRGLMLADRRITLVQFALPS